HAHVLVHAQPVWHDNNELRLRRFTLWVGRPLFDGKRQRGLQLPDLLNASNSRRALGKFG
ncbi:MAG: hypothetical protein ABW061_17995, partial [Polyangiaceae bacterium]